MLPIIFQEVLYVSKGLYTFSLGQVLIGIIAASIRYECPYLWLRLLYV